MPVESAKYIAELVDANPSPSDPKSQGDDHLRMLKSVLQQSAPGFAGVLMAYGESTGSGSAYVLTPEPAIPSYEVGMLVFMVANHESTGAASVNISALGAKDIVHTSGVAVSTGDIVPGQIVVLQYNGTAFLLLAGSGLLSKSGAQTYHGDLGIDGSLTVDGDVDLQGSRVLVPTLPWSLQDTNDAASVGYVNQAVFSGALPGQAGNAHKTLVTDGANASWQWRDFMRAKDISGPSYTVTMADAGMVLRVTGTTSVTFGAGLINGFHVYVENVGTGLVRLVGIDGDSSATPRNIRPKVIKHVVARQSQPARAFHLFPAFISETFTTSGPFSKEWDDVLYFVELIGAGGGGYNSTGSVGTSQMYIGGSGGQYVAFFAEPSHIPNGAAIAIGAPGQGRQNGTSGDGASGGSTSFGEFIALGGRGGANVNTNATSWFQLFNVASGGEGFAHPPTDLRSLAGRAFNFPGAGAALIYGASGQPGVSQPGISVRAGNGGTASTSPGVRAANGAAPGGGGGSSAEDGGGGDGARGEMRLFRFKG